MFVTAVLQVLNHTSGFSKYMHDTAAQCEWNYTKQDLVKLIKMKGQLVENYGTETEDINPGVRYVGASEVENTNIDTNVSDGSRLREDNVEKELERFAHLLIEETTDLYYRTKGASKGTSKTDSGDVNSNSTFKGYEKQTISDRKTEQLVCQKYERVEPIKGTSEIMISISKGNGHHHRKATFTHKIGNSDHVVFRHRNDKNDLSSKLHVQQMKKERYKNQSDPFLWQPETYDFQEKETLGSFDKSAKYNTYTKVIPNGSTKNDDISSIKDSGNSSSDYNYVLLEDDLLLPEILSSDENCEFAEVDQSNIAKQDTKTDEDMPILECETDFHEGCNTSYARNMPKIQINEVIKPCMVDVLKKYVAYDKPCMGNNLGNGTECLADSTGSEDNTKEQTSEQKYTEGVMANDSEYESQCLTDSSCQTIQGLEENATEQTCKQDDSQDVLGSNSGSTLACPADSSSQASKILGENANEQTSERHHTGDAVRNNSVHELDCRLSRRVGKGLEETLNEQIREQNVTENMMVKNSANELECHFNKGLEENANQRFSEQNDTVWAMRNNPANELEYLESGLSQFEVTANEQSCKLTNTKYTVRNNSRILASSSSQFSNIEENADEPTCENVDTEAVTQTRENEISLSQKIEAMDLNASRRNNEIKTNSENAFLACGTRINLSRKNINDMSHASIKKVNVGTKRIFSSKSRKTAREFFSSDIEPLSVIDVEYLSYPYRMSDVWRNPLPFETRHKRLSNAVKYTYTTSKNSSLKRRQSVLWEVSDTNLSKGLTISYSLFGRKETSTRKREHEKEMNGCDDSNKSCNDSNNFYNCDISDGLQKYTIDDEKAANGNCDARDEMDTERLEQRQAIFQTENTQTFAHVPENHSKSSEYLSVDSITNKLHDISVNDEKRENVIQIINNGTSFNKKFLEFIEASSDHAEQESQEENHENFVDGTRVKERKTYLDEDLDDDEIDGKRNYSVDEKLSSTKYNKSFVITDLKGEDFNLKYLQEHGLQDPIYFKEKTGLGLRVPSENFQVSDVKACVGSRRMLDVMDVTTQKGMEMSMKEWVKYYENPEKDKLLNVISLEFSHTKLENYVESPSLVREVDWVDIAWPQHLKDCQTESTNVIDKMKYPKVQKYCLMSVKGCYTDFHIDFGGTSVWYHILHGEKVFWLIPPTPKNLATYENWVLSAKQGDVFLGDIINECQKVTLSAGSTFIIPSGWIHAVYTPKDSLVFGGNFLHSFNIDKQLTVSAIEEKTHVPGKFRYPFYAEIGWYVLERYVHCVTGQTYLEKPKLSDDLELQMSGMSTSPESPLYDDFKPETPKQEQEIMTPKLPKRVAVTLTRIDSQSPRRQSSSDDDSIASGPPRSPLEASNEHLLYRKSSTESSTSVPDTNTDSKHNKTVSSVQKGKDSSSVKKKMKSVFLTKYEKIGLTRLVQWIEDLPPTKKGIPKDLLNPEAVMREIKRILEEHMNDSEKMAATGQPILVWTKATKKLIKMKQKAKLLGSSHVTKGTGKASKGSGDRHRRVRCKKCEPCTRDDCRECNFCKDMKKYGGPGRMKQSCISRQCLAPCLANSAICKICNKDTHLKDSSGDETSTLMECGICWEIVHPNCLKGKENLEGEGMVNEDMPNSWICLKCHTDGKERHLKPRVFKGGWRPSPAATPSPVASPNPEIHPIGDEIVTEGKRVVSKQPTEQPKVILPKSNLEGSVASSGITQSSWQQTFEKSVSLKSETTVIKEEESSEVDMEVEESKPILKPISQTSVKKSVKRKSLATPEETEKAQKKSKLSISVSPKGKGKSPKPSKPPALSQSASGKKAKKSPLDDSNPLSFDPPTLGRPKREEGNPATHYDPSTSYDFDDNEFADNQTMTLPLLEKGKGAIAKGGRRQKSGKLFRAHVPEMHNPVGGGAVGVGGGAVGVGASSLKLDLSGSPVNKFSLRKKPEDIGKVLLEHIEKRGLKVAPQKYVVRPIPVSPTKAYTEMVGGEKHPLPYTVWTKIFSYLSQADLAHCLCVCRIWNRWCINPELWKEIDLSRNRIVQNHLMGIVRRQPESLILSSVIMTPKQLTWIVERIPLLKKLVLSKCSWATMSGLCTSACPLLTELDISWATGISDQFFEDLITPPVDRKPGVKNISRLHRLKILSIAGTEITHHAIELITVHLSRLEVLDLSYCTRITDQSIQSLANPKSATQETLKVLNLSGCRQLTDASLQMIKNFKHLSHLSMSACNKISADAFRHFGMHGLVQFIH